MGHRIHVCSVLYRYSEGRITSPQIRCFQQLTTRNQKEHPQKLTGFPLQIRPSAFLYKSNVPDLIGIAGQQQRGGGVLTDCQRKKPQLTS